MEDDNTNRAPFPRIWVIIATIGVIIFSLVLRWNSFNVPFERDEGEYAYSAWLLKQGVYPYEHAFIQKPPLIIFVYMVCQAISPDSFWLPRVLAWIAVIVATALVGLVAAREYSTKVGVTAMWFLTPMMVFPSLAPYAANTEVFMVLPLVGTVALYVWKRADATRVHWFIAGACSALAMLFKQIAVPVVLFVFLVWLVESWIVNNSVPYIVKNALYAVAGGIVITVPVLGVFFLHDGGRSMWECVVTYNYYYMQGEQLGMTALIFNFKIFLKYWWFLFILILWYWIVRPVRWWFFTGAMIVAVLAVYRTWLSHYYLMVLPFWAMISAAAIHSAFDQVRKYLQPSRILKGVFVVVIVLLVELLTASNERLFTKGAKELLSYIYSDENPFYEAPVIADRIRALTSNRDYVFIAGSEPQMLYYAKRKSASRFVIMYPLMINTPHEIRYQEETINDILTNAPKVIVFVRTNLSWLKTEKSPDLILPFLNKLLDKEYHLVGGLLNTDNGRQWKEPLESNEIGEREVLLFSRDSFTKR